MRYINGKPIIARYRNGKPVVARYRYGELVYGEHPIPPSPHTVLNFIQSDGDQYLELPHKGTTDTNLKIIFSVVDDSLDSTRIFGAFQVNAPTTVRYEGMYLKSQSRIRVGNGSSDALYLEVTMEDMINSTHTIDFNKNGRNLVDGTDVGEYINTTADSIANIGICTRISNTGSIENRGSRGKLKIHKIELRSNSTGILTADFIPVSRNLDSVICMYDNLSKTYITNKGSGVFIGG